MLALLRRVSLGLTAFALAFSNSPVLADGASAQQTPTTADIRLANGSFAGHVVDAAGQPVQTTVAVYKGQTEISRVQSAQDGSYVLTGLRHGNYTVATEGAVQPVRLWEAAAPTKATSALTIQESATVRGQLGGGRSTLLTIGVVGGIVGGTIAIVDANNDGHDVATP